MRAARSLRPPLMVILAVCCCVSCTSKEREARNLLIQARTLIIPGKTVELVEHLKMIVTDYPETDAAVIAREMLSVAIGSGNRQAEMKLREAWVTATIFFIAEPYGTLDMAKLVREGFKRDQEVIVRVVNGTSYELKITSRHVVGDKLYSMGADGNVTSGDYVTPLNQD